MNLSPELIRLVMSHYCNTGRSNSNSFECNRALLTCGLVSKGFLLISRALYFSTRVVFVGQIGNITYQRSRRLQAFFATFGTQHQLFIPHLHLDITLQGDEELQQFTTIVQRRWLTLASLTLREEWITPPLRLAAISLLGAAAYNDIRKLTIRDPQGTELFQWLDTAAHFQRLGELGFDFSHEFPAGNDLLSTSHAPSTLKTLTLGFYGQAYWALMLDWVGRGGVFLTALDIGVTNQLPPSAVVQTLNHPTCSRLIQIRFLSERTAGVDLSHLRDLEVINACIMIDQPQLGNPIPEALVTLSSLRNWHRPLLLNLDVGGLAFMATLALDAVLVDLARTSISSMAFNFVFVSGDGNTVSEHISRWLPGLAKLTETTHVQEYIGYGPDSRSASWVMKKVIGGGPLVL